MNKPEDDYLEGYQYITKAKNGLARPRSKEIIQGLADAFQRQGYTLNSQSPSISNPSSTKSEDTNAEIQNLRARIAKLERALGTQTEILYQLIFQDRQENSLNLDTDTDLSRLSAEVKTLPVAENQKILSADKLDDTPEPWLNQLMSQKNPSSVHYTTKIINSLESSLDKKDLVLLTLYLLQQENNWLTVSFQMLLDFFQQTSIVPPKGLSTHLYRLHQAKLLTKHGKGIYCINYQGWKRLIQHPLLFVHLRTLASCSSQENIEKSYHGYSVHQLFSLVQTLLRRTDNSTDQLLILVYFLQIIYQQPTVQRSKIKSFATHLGLSQTVVSTELNKLQRGNTPLLFRRGKNNYSLTQLGLKHLDQLLA